MGKMNKYPKRFYIDGDFIHLSGPIISGDSAFSANHETGRRVVYMYGEVFLWEK